MAAPGRFASHDPKMISVFEIVGSYHVDILYNHIYRSSRTSLANGTSLTDEYVRQAQAFVIGVKNDEHCYGDVVQGIHRYFTGLTRYTALSFGDFVDRIVGVCVPEDYFRQFTPQDKDEMLSSVVCDLVANLAAFATKPDMLRRIIDEHDRTPEVTIRMLQDAAVNALIAKKSALFNKFFRKMGQARDHVPMDLLDDMKKALRRLVKEKASATARADEAEEALDAVKKSLREARVREAKLRKLARLALAGRNGGAAAAGAALRVPARDDLAEEDPLASLDSDGGGGRGGRAGRVPRRERIAEPRSGESESGESDEADEADESESEDEGEDEGSPGKRRGGRGGKGGKGKGGRRETKGARGASGAGGKNGKPARGEAQPTVSADFFKTGAVTAAQLGQRPAAGAGAGASAGAPAAGAGSRPAMLTNLLDNVVDNGPTDDDLNEILYGAQ